MTITSTMTKAESITAIARALAEMKRIADLMAFYAGAERARDAQEVLLLVPADIEVRHG